MTIIRTIPRTILVAMCLSGLASQSSAQGFLDHRSKGMQACVGAILGKKERKHVNVHGHHFNCKPISRRTGRHGTRVVVRLSHDQFGKDDRLTYSFWINGRGKYVKNTLRIKVSKGISVGSLWRDFDGASNFSGVTYNDIAGQVTGIKPVKVKRWQTAAAQILFVVVAQLGWKAGG